MIILLNESGQTGNRLRSLSSFLALGLESNQSIICPTVPNELCQYLNFNFKNKSPIDVKFTYNQFWVKISKVLKKIKILDRATFFNGKVTIFTDWISFAIPELNGKYYSSIMEFFDFKEEFKDICKGKMPIKSSESTVFVAVHMRSGDYRTWQNGKYYFETKEFEQQMDSLYMENPNICYLIFSNESINQAVCAKKPYKVYFMQGSVFEDLCCMSLCDYIVGPPSTFSAWAGYIGNRKLLWMKEKNHIYYLSDFQNVPNSMTTTQAFWSID